MPPRGASPRLTWRFEPSDGPGFSVRAGEAASLRCRLPHAPELELRQTDTGWTKAAATSLSGIVPNYEPEGDVDVVGVWFSVLNRGGVPGTILIRDAKRQRVWVGRHQWSSGGWQITLDADPDLRQKWEDAKDARRFLVHCGRLTRTDGQPFRFRDAVAVLRCLHWSLSFGRDRRVGLALASGFAAANPRVRPDHSRRGRCSSGFEEEGTHVPMAVQEGEGHMSRIRAVNWG